MLTRSMVTQSRVHDVSAEETQHLRHAANPPWAYPSPRLEPFMEGLGLSPDTWDTTFSRNAVET